jgi:hypothetical protein
MAFSFGSSLPAPSVLLNLFDLLGPGKSVTLETLTWSMSEESLTGSPTHRWVVSLRSHYTSLLLAEHIKRTVPLVQLCFFNYDRQFYPSSHFDHFPCKQLDLRSATIESFRFISAPSQVLNTGAPGSTPAIVLKPTALHSLEVIFTSSILFVHEPMCALDTALSPVSPIE